MKIIKMFSLLSAMSLSIGAFSQNDPAQAAPKPKTAEQRADEITARMISELDLSAEQTEKIKAEALVVAKELVAIDDMRQTDHKNYKASRKAILDKANERFLPLLTPQQAERYKLLQTGGAKKKEKE